jgi:hypothetical protein
MKIKFLDIVNYNLLKIDTRNFGYYQTSWENINSYAILFETLNQLAVKFVKKLYNISSLIIPIKISKIQLVDFRSQTRLIEYNLHILEKCIDYIKVNIQCSVLNINCDIIVKEIK